ncbi:unnamed protein product, partial [Polarella glacialis]
MVLDRRSCYRELGVPVGASAAEVRRAFFKIARRCHPDKCNAPGAAERFRRAHGAFEVLVGRAAPAEFLSDSEESDGWEPPPPPAAKPPPEPEPEPEEPLPILCLAGLLHEVAKCHSLSADSAAWRRQKSPGPGPAAVIC